MILTTDCIYKWLSTNIWLIIGLTWQHQFDLIHSKPATLFHHIARQTVTCISPFPIHSSQLENLYFVSNCVAHIFKNRWYVQICAHTYTHTGVTVYEIMNTAKDTKLTGSRCWMLTTSPMAPLSISSFSFRTQGVYRRTWHTVSSTLFSLHAATISLQSASVVWNKFTSHGTSSYLFTWEKYVSHL